MLILWTIYCIVFNTILRIIQDVQQDDKENGGDKATYTVPLAIDCKSKEDVTQYIANRVNAIKEQETYDNQIVLESLKGIGRMYWDQKSRRSVSSKALADNNFGGMICMSFA